MIQPCQKFPAHFLILYRTIFALLNSAHQSCARVRNCFRDLLFLKDATTMIHKSNWTTTQSTLIAIGLTKCFELISLNSLQFIANVMQFEKGKLWTARFCCTGTIIGLRHVLTTAVCVDLASTFSVGVQEAGRQTSRKLEVFCVFLLLIFLNVSVEADRVYIHPKFITNFVSNVAVIRVSKLLFLCFRCF